MKTNGFGNPDKKGDRVGKEKRWDERDRDLKFCLPNADGVSNPFGTKWIWRWG